MIAQGPALPFLASRDHSVETRTRLDVLTAELSSGRKSDLGRAVASDFSRVSRIAHHLRTYDARNAALSGGAVWLEVAQTSMGKVQAAGDVLAAMIPAALTPSGTTSIANLAVAARSALADMGAALNVSLAGRPIFANGDPGAGKPLDIDRLMAETGALAAAAGDLPSLLQAFDDYFAPTPSTGIEANAIRPYTAEAVSIPIGDGGSFDIPVSLADQGIRDILKQAALVAALTQTGFPIDEVDRARLAIELPVRTATAADGITAVRSRIGGVEERVERIAMQLGEERTRIESRQAEVIASDPFETASRLQGEMTRLETIFAVTARRARLRLTDYIR